MKKLLALLLICLFVCSFAACGAQPAADETKPAEQPAATEPETTEPETTEPETTEPETTEPEAAPAVVYNAIEGFSAETCEGEIWQYGYTVDGYKFTLSDHYDSPDWDGDGNANASQWYGPAGTGVGINYDSPNYIEVNNNGAGECAGIGFKAPADGTYVFSGTTWNQYEQESSGMLMNCWDQQLEIIPFTAEEQAFEYEVTISAGTVVWFWVADEYSWVSAYMTLSVTAK